MKKAKCKVGDVVTILDWSHSFLKVKGEYKKDPVFVKRYLDNRKIKSQFLFRIVEFKKIKGVYKLEGLGKTYFYANNVIVKRAGASDMISTHTSHLREVVIDKDVCQFID